jgi:hypothetical protein
MGYNRYIKFRRGSGGYRSYIKGAKLLKPSITPTTTFDRRYRIIFFYLDFSYILEKRNETRKGSLDEV